MREIDRLTTERCGIPSLVLMENAAIATARVVIEYLSGDVSGKSILVFCGKGNNGGDGAVAARPLAMAGARVNVVLIGDVDDWKADARDTFNRFRVRNDEQTVREGKTTTVTGLIRVLECES